MTHAAPSRGGSLAGDSFSPIRRSDVSKDQILRSVSGETRALVTRCTPVSRGHFAFITRPAPLCLPDKIGGEQASEQRRERTRAGPLSGKLVSGEIKLEAP